MLRRVFSLIFVFVVVFQSQAQLKKNIEYSGFFDSYYWRGPWSIIGEFGTSFYSGDFCGSLDCQQLTPSYGGGIAYKPWPRVQFGVEYTYLNLASSDHEPTRGYSFTSSNHEISAFGKFYIVEDIVRKHKDIFKKPKLIKPFFKLGFGAILINPVTLDASDSVVTEAFNTLNYQIPFALGFNFDLSKRFSIILEFDMRYTLTDQLDGYSQSSTSGSNISDMYGGAFLKVQYSPFAPRVRKKKHKLSPPTSEPKDAGDGSSPSNGRPDGGVSKESSGGSNTVDDIQEDNSENQPVEEIVTEEEESEEDVIEEESYEEESYDDYSEDEYEEEEYYEDDYSEEDYEESPDE